MATDFLLIEMLGVELHRKLTHLWSQMTIHLQARQLDIAQSNMSVKIAKYFPSGKRIIALMA